MLLENSVSDILGIDDQTLLEQLDDDELLFDDYDEYEDDYQGSISSSYSPFAEDTCCKS